MIKPSREVDSQALVPHNSHHPAYSSINSENGDIRLLDLLPGQYDDPLHIRLLPKKTSEDIDYEAVSYAWGTVDSPHEAYLDGTPISIRISLDLGLRRLRYAEKSRILWVDALCINQNDVQERSHQVQQMATIYSSATTVLIWLGEWSSSDKCQDQEHCEKAFSELLAESRRINSKLHFADKNKQDFSSTEFFGIRTDLFRDMHHFMGHLTDICSQPWYGRLWIIQEFILAKEDPLIHIGRHVARWLDFFNAIKISQEHWKYAQYGIKNVYCYPLALDKLWEMRYLRKTKKSLMWWLSYSFDFHATDSRDNIYGLLGICDFQVADPIVPDYSKSFQQVLAETLVVDIIEESPERYLHCPLTHIRVLGYDFRRPSWLLDGSSIMSRPPRMRGPLILSLEERKRRNGLLRLSGNGRTLFTQGRYIGTIATALSYVPRRIFPKYDQTLGAPELFEFYHKILKPISITPQRFLELLESHGASYFGSGDFVSYFAEVETFHRDIEVIGNGQAEGAIGSSRTLVVTEEGHFAMTWHEDPVGIRAGDVVVNLFGYNVPFILRPLRGGETHVMLNVAQFEGVRTYDGDDYDWVRFEGEGGEEYALI
jgi:hypothetical protein